MNFKKLRNIEGILLVSSALGLALLFSSERLDLWLAGKFFVSGQLNLWPHEFDLLWRFFYFAAPFIAVGLCLPALVLTVGSFFKESWLQWRRRSLFVLVSLLLGPGLLINTVFKPNWGRPRPRQIVEFGGLHTYQAFWQKTTPAKGMSFPCGHCSVGFFLVALAYLLKDKKPRQAFAIFILSIAAGLLMGLGRVAAGAHFISDVLWAGWMTYFATHITYYYVLKMSQPEPSYRTNPYLGYALGVGMIVASISGPLLATPFQKKIKQEWRVSALTIQIDKGDVEVIPISGTQEVRLEGDIKGFGLPMSKIIEAAEGEKYSISRQGFFTEVEARYKLYLTSDLTNFALVISKGGAIVGPQISPQYRFHQEKY